MTSSFQCYNVLLINKLYDLLDCFRNDCCLAFAKLYPMSHIHFGTPLIFICMLGLFTSCTTYQYTLLGSDLPKDQSSEPFYYLEENDVVIYFDFFGYYMPVDITVHNDAEEPLYIDLSGSRFLQNGRSLGLVSAQPEMNDPAGLVQVGVVLLTDSTSGIASPSKVAYLPPGGHFIMRAYPFDVVHKDLGNWHYNGAPKSNTYSGLRNVKWHDYEGRGQAYGLDLRMSRDNNFQKKWVSEARFREVATYESRKSPEYFPLKGGDFYVTSEEKDGSGLLAFFTILGLAVLVIGYDGEEGQ